MKLFQNKKTKIVATLGPASRDKKILTQMIQSGLNVARMNFSHGTIEDHTSALKIIRSAEKSAKKRIAILQDLCGPKIRIGIVENDQIEIVSGNKIILTIKKCIGTPERISVNYKKLPQELSVGNVIKIEDGKKELHVTKISGDDIHCDIITGGLLGSRKGINLPDVELSISSLTAKDKKDVLFGIEHKVDFIAFSFVQTKKDVLELRRILDKHKCQAKIISKIETTAAIKNIDDIIEASDGIMVARGDMAVEVGAERVPMIQKMIIKKCNALGKPVITATQMLDSMEKSPVPTRAEVSDVANAILDGSDAIMLSGETAIGNWPVLAIETMVKIAQRTEQHHKNSNLEYTDDPRNITDTLSVSAVRIANHIRARLIITVTESGDSARNIAQYRPHHGVIALTPNATTFGQIQMSYGCLPVMMSKAATTDDLEKVIQKIVTKNNWANAGEQVVVTTEQPLGKKSNVQQIFVMEVK